jgi:acetylornithine aminotransferase
MKLEKLDKKYILDTYPKRYINFKYGKNATLYANKDIEYIDFMSGIGVVSVGHGNKKVAKAISNQASKLIHTSNLYSIKPQILLANKIAKLSKMDVAIFFANSGAEANEGAIKIARKYGETKFGNKKYKIITLENSFHGRTITTVKATGQKSMHKKDFSPYPDGFSYNENIASIYNSIDDETVAVMIELVQGEGGVEPFDKKEIVELANYLKDKKILFIVDEVQTGVYRTGEFLACNLYGIEPDIITLAKGLGGGVPIGAVLTSHKDIFSKGDHGSTFGGNYLSTTASLQVLKILKSHKDSKILDNTIDYFDKKLDKILSAFGDLFDKKVGVGFIKGLRAKNEKIQKLIIDRAFENGLLVIGAGKNTVRFLPPLTITKREINRGFKRLHKALATIQTT